MADSSNKGRKSPRRSSRAATARDGSRGSAGQGRKPASKRAAGGKGSIRRGRKPLPKRGAGASGSAGRGRKPASKGAPGRSESRRGDGHRTDGKHHSAKGPRRDLRGAARDLPRWIVDALSRVTPGERVPAALEALGEASAALADGRFHPAQRFARNAKELSPRDATVREILGLASYRLGDWGTALAELRTYRRLSGESTHLSVEMDVLRAMGRKADVEEAWNELERRGDVPAVLKEGRVVYGSFLIDEGRTAEARRVVTPRLLTNNPYPEDLRLWYVAARAAALEGDYDEAVRFRNAILVMDPSFPGIDELDSTISAHPPRS